MVMGFVAGRFWFGSMIEDLGFLYGCWSFMGFGLDHWFWVCCGVVSGRLSQSHIKEM